VGSAQPSSSATYPHFLHFSLQADTSSGTTNTEGVNTKGYRDNTPLHLACQQGHYELCKLLIERGANVKSRNRC
jgi:ankyrin repeat protein